LSKIYFHPYKLQAVTAAAFTAAVLAVAPAAQAAQEAMTLAEVKHNRIIICL